MHRAARILIVDNETNARNALGELLRSEGYDVETARDGVDAEARLAQFQPDLVLTDVNMPRRDGLALAAIVRACADPAEVVLMSAHDRPASLCAAFVQKPIVLGELLDVLEQALLRRRGCR